MKNRVRILIQEADDDFRDCIVKELRGDTRFTIVKCVKSFYSLDKKADTLTADIIVIDWRYPIQQLFDFIVGVKMNNSETKVFLAFDFIQPDFIFQSLKYDVSGFLLKPFSIKEIMNDAKQDHNKKLQFHIDQLQHAINIHLTSFTR